MGFHAAAQAGVLHLHLGAADHPQLQHLASATNLEQPLFGPRLRYRRACSYLQTWKLDEASCDFDLVLAHASHLRKEAAFDAHAGKVLTHELQGDRRDADREFRRLAELVENFSGEWETNTLASLSSRRALLRGDLSTALVWARDYDEQMQVAELLTCIESTAMTRARVLAASEHADDWNLGLEGLKNITEKCGFIPAFGIQITALRAMLEYRRGNTEQAATALSGAIELARPGGTLLPFVEPGLRMQALFDDAAIGLLSDEFVTRIRGLQDDFIHRMSSTEQTDTEPAADLTNREMDILTLLAERLQNKEIAARLFVSPETVKTHLKNLYQKLGVRSRREAVAQAGELLRSN
jgi:LuxR family maltose regulon positive regulatory protein